MRDKILSNPGNRHLDELALAILDPESASPAMLAFRNEFLIQVKRGLHEETNTPSTNSGPLGLLPRSADPTGRRVAPLSDELPERSTSNPRGL